MDAVRQLIESYKKHKCYERKHDEIAAEQAVNEGLNQTLDLLRDIEADKIRRQAPKNLSDVLRDLRSYLSDHGRNVSYISAKVASIALVKIIELHKAEIQSYKITSDHNEAHEKHCISCLEEFIQITRELRRMDRFETTCFMSSIMDLNLPGGILCALHNADLVSVTVYLIHIVDNENALNYFISDIISLLGQFQRDDSLRPFESSIHVLVIVLQQALGEDIAEPGPSSWQICNKACRMFVDQFLSQIRNHLLSNEDSVDFGNYLLHFRGCSWKVGEGVLQEFLKLNLESLKFGPKIAPEKALSCQQHWMLNVAPPSYSAYVQNILVAMGQEVAISTILDQIEEETSQWQDILFFISIFLKMFQEGAAALKAFVDDTLRRALTKNCRSLLANAFLIARQACFSLNHSGTQSGFPSYGTWFGSMFGVEAGSVPTSTNATSFSFLMEFLTDLVPTDPPLCLRVHINKVPSAPAHCSHLLTDFVSLTKTRLCDLGEATGSGLFAFENTPADDVAAALSYFENSGGQISRVLLDSSKFRRTQFENHFLPALLVAEPCCEENTVRQRLILKLQIAGKIPSSMMRQYQEACQRITSHKPGQKKLMPSLGDPLEKWRSVLELFVDSMRNEGLDSEGEITEQGKSVLSTLAKLLDSVLKWVPHQSDPTAVQGKVVGRLFKACELCFDTPIPPGIQKSPAWLHRLIILLKSQPTLLRQFHGAIHRIACNSALSTRAMKASAYLTFVFDTMEDAFLKVTPNAYNSNLGESIVQGLLLTSQKKMLHALTLCSEYLRLIENVSPGICPSNLRSPSILRTLFYLQERLMHSTIQDVVDACRNAWNPPSSWVTLLEDVKLSLSEWLELEASIERTEDPLTDRYLYMCEWIMQHCDPNPFPELFTASLMYTSQGNQTFTQEILHVIPSLPMSHNTNERKEYVPQLLETWMEVCTKFPHQDILKAIHKLPSWMLLSNAQGARPTSCGISTLADLIEKNIDKMNEKGFLSLQVITLIVAAVRGVDPNYRSEIFSEVIDSCPHLLVGVLKHNKPLKLLLIPSFSSSLPFGSKGELIVKLLANPYQPEHDLKGNVWMTGLIQWTQGNACVKPDNGALFFHLLDLGNKLLTGAVTFVMGSEGPLLPSTTLIAETLIQEPQYTLKLLKDASKVQPCSLPATGISCHSRSGLALAYVGVLLSLDKSKLPPPHSEANKMCLLVLQQCLALWTDTFRGLVPCEALLQRIDFVQWLTKRTHFLQVQLQRTV